MTDQHDDLELAHERRERLRLQNELRSMADRLRRCRLPMGLTELELLAGYGGGEWPVDYPPKEKEEA